MTDDSDRRGSSLAVPVLLALMFLAQLGIANEIRYQGCVARVYDALALSDDESDAEAAARRFGCERVPLL